MNALTMFSPGAQVPAHIARLQEQLGTNIVERPKVNSLSYTGKVWTLQVDGAKQQLNTKTADGDIVPLQVIRTVILGYAPRRGRAYYDGGYDPNNTAPPKCWSVDGEAPDDSVSEPQSDKCSTCQWSVKGSKTNDAGNPVTACSSHRLLAVVPSTLLGKVPPLRLKIAITSDYDKQSPDQNKEQWFAFSDYVSWLKTNGVSHTAMVVTAIKFDPNEAYPKLFFRADGWIDPAKEAEIAELVASDATAALVTDAWTAAGTDGVATDKPEPVAKAAPVKAAPAAKAKPAAKPQPEPVVEEVTAEEEDTGMLVMEDVTQPPAAAQEAVDILIMGDDEPAPVTKPAKVAKPSPAASSEIKQAQTSTVEVPEDVAGLLADWDS